MSIKLCTNYYSLFNLIPTFEIDLKQLSKKFHNLQKKYHPDVNIKCNLKDRKKILQKSILINKGYYLLKDPIERGKYLLFLNGITINQNNNSFVNNNFLEYQFKLYEKLEYFKKNICKLEECNLFFKKICDLKQKFFDNFKSLCIKKEWKIAKNWLIKVIFLEKIKNETEKLIDNI
ncbi:co-chaperone protein HscB homolog [Buchnera aphidicola (Nipponaphis monzeni)]|uniref:Co-chaperone protein HscB n=1 Tax=Buchnera aphidicola (Nipponaphis monzeni) TaxID=2495405 RepID=A0A455TAT2_9GAMM|nr:Fe-S protein assembly co-chaperone HscB [Buchnera aphidicola]BBI01448.1 co-chaperone protein HscB homolog [Buchnera aphidicola (Nipponaphis monzeni)]